MSFLDTPELKRKGALIEGIIDSLKHIDRDMAMQIILMWFSVDDLEGMWPTITSGRPKPEVEK